MKNLVIAFALLVGLVSCSEEEEIKPVDTIKPAESEYVFRMYSNQKFSGSVDWVVSPVGWGVTSPALSLTYPFHKTLDNVTEFIITVKMVKDQTFLVQLKGMSAPGNYTMTVDGKSLAVYDFPKYGLNVSIRKRD